MYACKSQATLGYRASPRTRRGGVLNYSKTSVFVCHLRITCFYLEYRLGLQQKLVVHGVSFWDFSLQLG